MTKQNINHQRPKKMKLIAITSICFLLATQQAHAFLWLLAAGMTGYAISEDVERQEIKARRDSLNQSRYRELSDSEELALCIKNYKSITDDKLELSGTTAERLGFCKGSLKFEKSKGNVKNMLLKK